MVDHILETSRDDIVVSTIRVPGGVEPGPDPRTYETLVMRKNGTDFPEDVAGDRYRTLAEAVAGHNALVREWIL